MSDPGGPPDTTTGSVGSVGSGVVETVLGPLAPSAIGRVDFHEHVLADSSGLHRPGSEPAPADPRVCVENLGYLRWNCLGLADNLRLDSVDDAVADLAEAAASFDLFVDATSFGLGPVHTGLPEVARRAGVAIVAAYGTYLGRVLPAEVAALDEDALEKLLLTALTEAVPGTAFRAGLIGIMGTTEELLPPEQARLRAAARAGAATGSCVTVRLAPDARQGISVIGQLTDAGLPADRIVLTNADEYPDLAYWADLSDAGATLEVCFGMDFQHVPRIRNPGDIERLDLLEAFLTARPDARIVLGGSLWTKAQLRRHGGQGYDHVARRIVPELLRRGAGADVVERMLHDEPLRQLTRPDRSADPVRP